MVVKKDKYEPLPRTLEYICEDANFSVILLENVYCSLAKEKKIDCMWQSNKKDHNGFYPCIRWQKKWDED